jgi:hypothetical protein
MGLKEWFDGQRYPGKFEFGARVSGKYKGIPFVGSVGTDNVRNEEEGPMCTVTLDLPIMVAGQRTHVIRVKPSSLKLRKEIE